MKLITKNEARTLLLNQDGSIFSITFTKKDGSIRQMNCRFGVKKHLKGGELAYDPLSKGLLPVYDLKNEGYRMISLNTIIELKLNGESYIITETR